MSSPVLRSLKCIVKPKVSPIKSPDSSYRRQLFSAKENLCKQEKLYKQEKLCKPQVFYKYSFQNKKLFPPLIHLNDLHIPEITSYIEKSTDIDIDKCHILGKGSFCTVILANYKGSRVAAKLVSKSNPRSINLASREKNIINLKHPNIVEVYKILDDLPNYILVLTELCQPTTLQSLIDLKMFNLGNQQKLSILIDISIGLDFCHEKGIIHLDIKPINILVDLCNKSCKICDFGNSIKLQDLWSPNKCKIQGTVKYMAPEILKGDKPCKKSDIYSLGITMWQMVHEEIPYTGLTNETLIYQVVTQDYRPTIREKFMSEEYKRCWVKRPENRPTIKELLCKLKIKLCE